MMFASADLNHIESEMLRAIADDTDSEDPTETLGTAFFDTIETPTNLYVWAKNHEAQRLQTLRRLERLWQSQSVDSPKKEYKKRGKS